MKEKIIKVFHKSYYFEFLCVTYIRAKFFLSMVVFLQLSSFIK